ncbi:MAG: YbjN domain-containing protein, partial [Pirellulaceae bacterium]
HFSSRDMQFQAVPEKNLVIAGFGGQHFRFTTFAQLTDDENLLQVFSYPGVVVPAGARKMIADLVARANYGIKVGKFELDMNDGELRYHACTVIANQSLSDAAIGILIGASLHALERYMPAVLSCIYGNEDPAQAYQSVAHEH